jgi:hypothetical protein
MSSNAIITAANQEIREAIGTEVNAGSPLLIGITNQNLRVIGFWSGHIKYVVGVQDDQSIIALNGVAKSVARKMGWKVLISAETKKAEQIIMPGLITLINIGLVQCGDANPDSLAS